MNSKHQAVIESLSPLQKAAADRIDFFTRELAKKGLYVRTGIELEFITEDQHQNPVSSAIKLTENGRFRPSEAFKPLLAENSEPYGNYIERVDYEHISNRMGIAQVPYQYEITLGEPYANAISYSPLMVAKAATNLKDRTLKETLMNTSALTQPAQRLTITPNFSPRPHFNREENLEEYLDLQEQYYGITSGTHVSISLNDANERNLFSHNDELMENCAKSLAAVQYHCLLPLLPSPESLTRIGANRTAPSGIGIVKNYKYSKHANEHISVCIRKTPPSGLLDNVDDTRIENRLAGADVDPLVGMAVTLAAIYNASLDTPIIAFNKSTILSRFATEIPKKHEKIIAEFERSASAKELLGDELYKQIQQNYGQVQSLSCA